MGKAVNKSVGPVSFLAEQTLANLLRQRGIGIDSLEVVSTKKHRMSYEICFRFGQTSKDRRCQVVLYCPRINRTIEDLSPIRIGVGSTQKIILRLPTMLVNQSDRQQYSNSDDVQDAFTIVSPSNATSITAKSSIDLLALIQWSLGYAPIQSQSLRNWSNYYENFTFGHAAAEPVLDYLMDELSYIISQRRVPNRYDPTLIITGDADSAEETEIHTYLDSIERVGGYANIIIRRPEQLTTGIVTRVKDGHSVGIHPYASDGSLPKYEESVKNLASRVREMTGQNPLSSRHHRFQWIQPEGSRTLLANEGVRIDFTLVASNDNCWIGAPTGFAFPIPIITKSVNQVLWIMPTIVEDEIFIYNLGYCFLYSNDRVALHPVRFVIDFLDNWVLERGLPACINLHPEHVPKPYDTLHKAILSWVEKNKVAAPPLESFLESIEARL